MVLPIPISPEPASTYPLSFSSTAISAPASMALTVSSIVMAGSSRKSFVPYATFRFTTPGTASRQAIPTSTGITSAPAWRAMRHTHEFPRAIFPATMAVTSCPVWVTPSFTTPLSPHMTTIALGRRLTARLPEAAAMRMISSSRTPRLPKGLATLSQRCFACCLSAWRAGLMLFIASFNVIAHVPLRHVLVRYALVCHVSGHVSVRIPRTVRQTAGPVRGRKDNRGGGILPSPVLLFSYRASCGRPLA